MYFGFNDEERDSGSDKDNRFSYFLNTSIKAYQKCNSNCLICIEKENQEHCLQCDNDNDYYIIRYSIQACRLQTMIIPRFYFNETEKAFIQYDNAWLINSSTLRVICVDICPEGSFIDKESNFICTINCNSKNPYKLNTTRECVSECPKTMNKIENNYCTPYIDISQEENDPPEREDISVSEEISEEPRFILKSFFVRPGANILK